MVPFEHDDTDMTFDEFEERFVRAAPAALEVGPARFRVVGGTSNVSPTPVCVLSLGPLATFPHSPAA